MSKEEFIKLSYLNQGSTLKISKEMEPERRVIGYNDEDGRAIVTTGVPREFNYGAPTYTNIRKQDDFEFTVEQLSKVRRYNKK